MKLGQLFKFISKECSPILIVKENHKGQISIILDDAMDNYDTFENKTYLENLDVVKIFAETDTLIIEVK